MKCYSLMCLLAMALLSGCAASPIQESKPLFSVTAHLTLGEGTPHSQPRAEISAIYRKGDPNKVFTPSPGADDLWLKPGAYIARINRCYQHPNDDIYIKYGTRLGPDHLFEFSVEGGQRYYLGCSTSSDGAIYASSVAIRFDALD